MGDNGSAVPAKPQSKLINSREMLVVDKALKAGAPRSLALKAAGISEQRMAQIQELARRDQEPYRNWIMTIEQIEAQAKVDHLSLLAKSPDWRAREKILKLTEPAMFEGAAAEYTKTYDWMLRVISEETDQQTFERIITRFAVEEPGGSMESAPAAEAEGELHRSASIRP